MRLNVMEQMPKCTQIGHSQLDNFFSLLALLVSYENFLFLYSLKLYSKMEHLQYLKHCLKYLLSE